VQVHIQASIVPRQDVGPESRHPLTPICFLCEPALGLQDLKLLFVEFNLPAIKRALLAQLFGLTGKRLLRIDCRDNRTNEQTKRRNSRDPGGDDQPAPPLPVADTQRQEYQQANTHCSEPCVCQFAHLPILAPRIIASSDLPVSDDRQASPTHCHAALGAMRCEAIPARAECRGPVALDNGLVMEVEPGRFEDMVVTALDGLPEELGQLMRNVAVTVEHRPGPPGLLGLYEGIPLTSRTSQYAGVLPDRITIYRQAICAICRTEQEVDDQVRRTVIHEIAHHFGIDDNRLSELGW